MSMPRLRIFTVCREIRRGFNHAASHIVSAPLSYFFGIDHIRKARFLTVLNRDSLVLHPYIMAIPPFTCSV